MHEALKTVPIAAPLIASASEAPKGGPTNKELSQTSYRPLISE
jgi:hypothetical protein